ncbi:VWA domain-containing protein [candidate division TA06 bacterium]|uniref:VWA domain-containing protein n=1 Tax=candidate division TA06 bacterium TaxID=2250710 RepID=A0A933MHV9_UNCT6|nr:VWA domain-containing protein [candidate division TA06 bacterium]
MIWALIIILLTAALSLGWRERPGLSRQKWAVLLALRLGAIIILGLALHGLFPRLWDREKQSLLILADASQSMTLNDGQPQSRWQRAMSIASALRLPGSRITVYRTTGDGLKEGLIDSLIKPLEYTDLSEALFLAFRNKPGAILLLSDGNHNRSDDPVRDAAAGIPVYVIGFGPAGGVKNALISDVWSDNEIEAGQTVEISLSLKGMLTGGWVSLWENGAKLAEKRFDLSGDTVATFTVIPKPEGIHRYTAVLENSDKQKLDQAAAVISVVKKNFNLIFICSTPEWTLKFWLQAISLNPSYTADLLIKQGTGWRMIFPKGQDSPGNLDSLDKYDAIILGNIKPGDLPAETELRVVNLVRQKGRGLFLLGSFSQGGIIGQTAPMFYSREIKPTVGTPWPAPELFSTGMLEASKEPDFKRLPPLSLNKDYSVRDKMVLLLASLQTSDKKNHPLWARETEGAGRIVQVAAEDLWRWKLAAAGAGRDIALFGEIVQSSLQWILGREGSGFEAGPGRILNVQGQDIKFNGRWKNYSRQSGQNAKWSVIIADSSGHKKTYKLADWGNGDFVAELGTLPSGQYSYTTGLELGGKQIYSARGKIFVEPGRDELRDYLQNVGLLKSMAAASGGQYWDENDIPESKDWSRKIKLPGSPSSSGQNPTGSILAICLLLAGEWFLRRKWGRV